MNNFDICLNYVVVFGLAIVLIFVFSILFYMAYVDFIEPVCYWLFKKLKRS